jgi:phosphoheptose isomerase
MQGFCGVTRKKYWGVTAMSIESYLRECACSLEAMATWGSLARVEGAIVALADAALANKPILVCGNGGSAADSMHIAGAPGGRLLKETNFGATRYISQCAAIACLIVASAASGNRGAQ